MDTAPTPPTGPIHLHLIAYSEETHASIAPGWQVLDNRANPRPDWYEVGPIRQFLHSQPLDETAFYGFFSPKFTDKTSLTHAQTHAFVAQAAPQADVVLFSPQPDMGAFFLNVFEQGETFDPGLIDAFEAFLRHIGSDVSVRQLVMDSRQICFSNYFAARPAFWREWLAVIDALVEVCDGPDSPVQQGLVVPTNYPPNVQRKVFLAERVASLLLTVQPHWRTVAHNPYGMGWSMSRFREHPTEAYISDALKIAMREQPFPEFMHAFATVRRRFQEGRSALG